MTLAICTRTVHTLRPLLAAISFGIKPSASNRRTSSSDTREFGSRKKLRFSTTQHAVGRVKQPGYVGISEHRKVFNAFSYLIRPDLAPVTLPQQHAVYGIHHARYNSVALYLYAS